MNALNKLLGLLPFDGKKTIVGLLVYALMTKWPDFPLPALQGLLEWLGLGYAGIGLAHKAVKVVDS